MIDEITKQLVSSLAIQRDAAIFECMPAVVLDISLISREVHHDGSEIFKYDGQPFMELRPAEFQFKDFKITAVQKYRKILGAINENRN